MYLMYVDESGDCGIGASPTRFFVLSGIVIHELRWRDYLDQLIDFRKRMKTKYALYLRDEIHAAQFINHPGELSRIPRNDRLSIIRLFAEELATMADINIINIICDKSTKSPDYDVFTACWMVLIQRLENTIGSHNFRGPFNADERGMILPDNTDVGKLTKIVRRMRRYNPIPNKGIFGQGYRNLLIKNIIEDPFFKDSRNSYFTQAADLSAYLLYQYKSPNKYMKQKAGDKYFLRLEPVLCKVASTRNEFGIVEF